MQTDRDLFEKALIANRDTPAYPVLDRDYKGDYEHQMTQLRWEGWQLSKSARDDLHQTMWLLINKAGGVVEVNSGDISHVPPIGESIIQIKKDQFTGSLIYVANRAPKISHRDYKYAF